jgi:hypothetical protein
MPDTIITIPEHYTTEHEREAYRLGADAALAAASWAADGNTSDDHRRAVLAMLEDGDPQAYDYLPAEPNLSGEWADGPTPTSLYGEIVGYNRGGGIDDPDGELTAALCEAWEAGVQEHFLDACEAELRGPLADGSVEPTGEPPHVGHFSRLGGTWWCDTCDSPYCDLA